MPDKFASVSTAKAKEGSLELTEELIRIRAYRFYEERGYEDGHDLDDWLLAGAEIAGRKPAAAAELEATEGKGKAASEAAA